MVQAPQVPDVLRRRGLLHLRACHELSTCCSHAEPMHGYVHARAVPAPGMPAQRTMHSCRCACTHGPLGGRRVVLEGSGHGRCAQRTPLAARRGGLSGRPACRRSSAAASWATPPCRTPPARWPGRPRPAGRAAAWSTSDPAARAAGRSCAGRQSRVLSVRSCALHPALSRGRRMAGARKQGSAITMAVGASCVPAMAANAIRHGPAEHPAVSRWRGLAVGKH